MSEKKDWAGTIIGAVFILLIVSSGAAYTYEFIKIFDFNCILLSGIILLYSFIILSQTNSEKKSLAKQVKYLQEENLRLWYLSEQNIKLRKQIKELTNTLD